MTRFYTELIIAVAIISALLVWGPAARAQVPMMCGPYKQVSKNLLQKFQEVPRAMGLGNSGSVVQVFVSDTGTWTMVTTTPKGLACLMTAGEAWQQLKKPKPTKSKGTPSSFIPVSSHQPSFKDKHGVVGSKRVVGVVCVQEGIDAFYEATLESPEIIEGVLRFLFHRGACLHNPNGFQVTLKKLYKSYEDYEGARLELWEVESQHGPASYTWSYMGK